MQNIELIANVKHILVEHRQAMILCLLVQKKKKKEKKEKKNTYVEKKHLKKFKEYDDFSSIQIVE